MAKPTAWSYSALEKFKTCPHQFYEVRVMKNFKEEMGEAATWGDYVHKCIENAIKTGAALPENVKSYASQVWRAIDGDLKYVRAEVELCLDKQMNPCGWKDWDRVWVRTKQDVLKIKGEQALVIDWKTGKITPDSAQLKLAALMVFYHYPEVLTCTTRFEWLKHRQSSVPAVYTREQVPELWDTFIPDLTQFVQAFKRDTWQPRPSGLCAGWCPVTTCQHWRPKR